MLISDPNHVENGVSEIKSGKNGRKVLASSRSGEDKRETPEAQTEKNVVKREGNQVRPNHMAFHLSCAAVIVPQHFEFLLFSGLSRLESGHRV